MLNRLVVLYLFCLVLVLGGVSEGKSKSKKQAHAPPTGHRYGRQTQPDRQRVYQIQTALVREGYLNRANGNWDEKTKDALRKYQSDRGWQTKIVPDSRTLINLGLGPKRSVLLNAETAAMMEYVPAKTTRQTAVVVPGLEVAQDGAGVRRVAQSEPPTQQNHLEFREAEVLRSRVLR